MPRARRKTKLRGAQVRKAVGSLTSPMVGLATPSKRNQAFPITMSSRTENGMVVTRVSGSDFVTVLNVTNIPASVTPTTALNSSYSLVYTGLIGPQFYSPSRLSSLAPLWERYKIKRLRYRFVPSVPATYTGASMMVCDHDSSDNLTALSTTEAIARVASAHYGVEEQQIWQNQFADLRDQDLQQNYYTDFLDPTDNATDIRLCAQGRFSFILTNQVVTPAGGVFAGSLGDLYIDYDIDFFYPQIDEGVIEGGSMFAIVNPPNTPLPVPATGCSPFASGFLNTATGRFGAQWLGWWIGDNAEIDQNRDASLASLVTDVSLVSGTSGALWVLVTLDFLGELFWSGSGLDIQPVASITAGVAVNTAFSNCNSIATGLISSTALGQEDSSSAGTSVWPYIDAPNIYGATAKAYNQQLFSNNSGIQPVAGDGLDVFSAVSGINSSGIGNVNATAALEYRFVTVSTNGQHQVAFLLSEPSGNVSITPNPQDTANPTYQMVVSLPDPPSKIYRGAVPTQPTLLDLKHRKQAKQAAFAKISSKSFRDARDAKRKEFAKLVQECKTLEDVHLSLKGTPHLKVAPPHLCGPLKTSVPPVLNSHVLVNAPVVNTVVPSDYVVLQPMVSDRPGAPVAYRR